MLRMPKDVADHPRREALESYFTTGARPIREGSRILVSVWSWDERIKKAIGVAAGAGHLQQGLEQIREVLEKEEKGLKAVQAKTGQAPAQRLSRLVLVSNDGTERFARDLEELLFHNTDRAHAVVLDVTAEVLGQMCTTKGRPVKALMIGERAALGWFLRNLADQL